MYESSLTDDIEPPVPGGVTASRPPHGTLLVHDNGFVGVIPHLVDVEGAGQHVAPYWRGRGGIVGRPTGDSATVRLACRDGPLDGSDRLTVHYFPRSTHVFHR